MPVPKLVVPKETESFFEVETVSKRDEIACKVNEKKNEDDAQHTFKPKLVSRRAKESEKSVPGSEFNRLYGEALKRQVSEANLKSKIEESKNIHNTFQPSISPRARSISRDSSTTTDRLHNASGAGRVLVEKATKDADLFKPMISKRAKSLDRSSPSDASARLYASKDKYKQNLDNKRAEDAKRTADKCSFSPLMSPKTRLTSSSTGITKSNVADRLHLLGENKKNKIEEATKDKLNKDMIGVTFQPTLIRGQKNTATTAGGPPVRSGRDTTVKVVTGSRFDHLYKDAIKRKTDDPFVRAKFDESHLTFKPTISPRARSSSVERKPSDLIASMHNASGAGRVSPQLVPKDVNSYKPAITKRASSLDRSASGNIVDRLHAYKEIQIENLDRKKYEEAVKEFEECTFAPNISPSNKDRLSLSTMDSVVSTETLSTVERLLEYGEKTKYKLQEEKRAAAERELLEVTFQPKLVSAQLSPDSLANRNQFDRLYDDAIKRKVDDPFVRARVDESDITFKPSISELASSLDRSTFEDINLRQKEHARKKKEAEMNRRAQEALFTHQPVITKRASSLDRSSLNRINERQKEQMIKEREETVRRNARQNTFAPRIPVFHTSRSPSLSIDTTSNSINASSGNGRSSISSATSASIGSRYTKPPANAMKVRIDEEKQLRVERELVLASAKLLKAQNAVAAAHATSPRPSPRISHSNLTAPLKVLSAAKKEENSTGEITLIKSDGKFETHDQDSLISEPAIPDLILHTPSGPKLTPKSNSSSKLSMKPVPNISKLSITAQIKVLKNESNHFTSKALPSSVVKKGGADLIPPPHKTTGRSV